MPLLLECCAEIILIAWVRKNNRAARAARFLLQCFDVVCQTTTWHVHRQRKPIAVNHSFFALAWKWKVHFIYFVRRDQDAIIAKQYPFTKFFLKWPFCCSSRRSFLKLPINSEVTVIVLSLCYCSSITSLRPHIYWVVYYRNSNSSEELKTSITKILNWKFHRDVDSGQRNSFFFLWRTWANPLHWES